MLDTGDQFVRFKLLKNQRHVQYCCFVRLLWKTQTEVMHHFEKIDFLKRLPYILPFMYFTFATVQFKVCFLKANWLESTIQEIQGHGGKKRHMDVVHILYTEAQRFRGATEEVKKWTASPDGGGIYKTHQRQRSQTKIGVLLTKSFPNTSRALKLEYYKDNHTRRHTYTNYRPPHEHRSIIVPYEVWFMIRGNLIAETQARPLANNDDLNPCGWVFHAEMTYWEGD